MRVKVGLVQINHSFYGQSFLPYSVALLQAYVEKFAHQPERFDFMLPIYKRLPVAQILEALVDADVVGFSTYAWNGRISIEVARRLKDRNPNVVVVFGGPHVPDDAESFLRTNPFIDVAVHNEGERAFLALLEQYPAIEAASIESASFVGKDGCYHGGAKARRISDLDQVPSPFLSGVLDRLIAAHPEESWIGLWETNRGCPFACTFCDWGSATASKVHTFALERLRAEIDWFSRHQIEFIYCCDANFGILKRDVEIAHYVAAKKRSTAYPKALSVQNTKNAIERAYETQKVLADAGLSKGVALSMQSLESETLINIKRGNISLNTYFELQRRFNRDGIDTYSDLILGLPGETYESFAEGADRLIASGQHTRIRFNNLSILPNSEMGSRSYRDRYGMTTVESKLIVLPRDGRESEDDVEEIQDLVVSTSAMPLCDWQRARVFGWMTSLLHFDRLTQIPLIVANHASGISYRRMIEEVMDVDRSYPLLAGVRDWLWAEAASIQRGGSEYPFSQDWLGMYWPTDEYVFITLTTEGQLGELYREMVDLFTKLLVSHGAASSVPAVQEAFTLNQALIKQPFVYDDIRVPTEHDIMGLYYAILKGEVAELRRRAMITHVERSKAVYRDLQVWCREVVWWSKQKGSYLYESNSSEAGVACLLGSA